MKFIKLVENHIDGVIKISYDSFEDLRGEIFTPYSDSMGINLDFVHDKFSINKKKTLRGIHFDSKTTKLVTCISGSIQQVLVDLRKNSPTFRNILSYTISPSDRFSLLVPPGVGNAFLALEDDTVYYYKLAYVGEYIDQEGQSTVSWNDLDLNINWRFKNPILSDRDKND